MDSGRREHFALPVALGLLAGVYSVGILLSLLPDAGGSTWWTEIGVIATFLVLVAPRHWPVVLAVNTAAFAALHVQRGDPFSGAEVVVAVLEPLAAGLVLVAGRRGPVPLETLVDFSRHLAAAGAAGTVGVVASLLVEGPGALVSIDQLARFGVVTASCLIATTAGARVLVDPTLGVLGVVQRPAIALQSLLTIGVVLYVFLPGQLLAIAFIPLPLLIWGAARYGVGTACWQVALAASAATYASTRGWGPFAGDALFDSDPAVSIILANSWNLTAACVALPIALAVQQQRLLTARLRSDEELFRRSFSEALVGMVFLHGDGERLLVDDVNAAGCRMLGRPVGDLVGVDVDAALSGADGALPVGHLLRGDADSWLGQASATARPGSRLQVSLSSLTAGGEQRFAAQLIDVTLEQEARRALQMSQELTNATLDTAACLILVTDLDGTLVRVNAATSEISGYGERELLGARVWETPISPYTESDVLSLFTWPNRSGAAVTREHLARRKDGSPLRLVWNTNTVRDEHGFPAYAVLTGIDVTKERSTASVMSHVLQASVATVLVGIDPEGRITLFNSGAEHLLGYRATTVIGQPFVSLLDPEELTARTGVRETWDAFAAIVAQLGDEQETPASDWTWIDQFDQRLVVSMNLSVTHGDLAEPLGYLCVARDVTAERRAEQALSSALDEERTVVERLRALDQAKDEFVSTVSHELRTPVTSIVGYTEMLLDGTVGDPRAEQRPMLDIVARNGRRLIDICGDLLLLSGVDSGSSVWDPRPVDLVASVSAAEETVGGLTEGRRLDVRFTVPGDEVVVAGDRSQLDRVVMNLVSNAVKFTPDGGRITVDLHVDPAEVPVEVPAEVPADASGDPSGGASGGGGAGAGYAVLSVADTGIGIPAADQQRVFERFYRTSRARGEAIPGTGLGLAIVRTVVETHGGTIDLTSRPGAGTTFLVRLPLAAQPVSTEPVPSEPVPSEPVPSEPARGLSAAPTATG